MATKVKLDGARRQNWVGSRVNSKFNRGRMTGPSSTTDNGISIFSIEELNRKSARKCINCCAILSDGNKNDMAKVVFSVNLVKTATGLDHAAKNSDSGDQAQVNWPNEKRVLMSALQAMDVMFQVNDNLKLKQTIGAGSMCHNCTKTFGSFFQTYLQFISCSQDPSPIRTLVQSIPSIRRNLNTILDDTGKPITPPKISMIGSTSSVTKPSSALTKFASKPGPNASTAAKAASKVTTKPKLNISIAVTRPELQQAIKQEPVVSQQKSVPVPLQKYGLKTVSSPQPSVISNANPTMTTARLIPKAKTVPGPTQQAQVISVRPVPVPPSAKPKPRLKIVPTPALMEPVPLKKEPDVDPLLEAEDDDLQSLLMSRGRKQQFTQVRDFDEPIFEVQAELLSEEEALSAASALAVVSPDPSLPPVLSRAKDGDGHDEADEVEEVYQDDDDEDYKPKSSGKKRKRIRVRKSTQKTESKAKTPRRSENKPAPEAANEDKTNPAQVPELSTPAKPLAPDPPPVQIKCDKCSELFQDSDNLNRHADMHDEGEAWKCLLCNCGFKDFDQKSKHMLRAHLTTSVRTRSGGSGRQGKEFQYGCGMCVLKFGVEAEFKEHLISAHFSCPTCVDDTFSSQEEINEHMDSHGAGWVGQPPIRSTRARPSIVAAAAVSEAPVKMDTASEEKSVSAAKLQDPGPKLGIGIPAPAPKPGRSRSKAPCPICGKIVGRVDRHVAEVHEGQKRIPHSSKHKARMRLKAKRAVQIQAAHTRAPPSANPDSNSGVNEPGGPFPVSVE